MSAATTAPAPAGVAPHRVTVLLVDDQQIVAEAVRRMLAAEPDIAFHYCGDPVKAIPEANRIGPTVILQDLVMPEVEGLTLLRFYRANPATRDVPVVVLSSKEEPAVKAQAFAQGASDYLVKLPDRVELVARIRHHSAGYINLLQRNEAYRALKESQRLLAEDMAQASQYVQSLLPAPLTGTPLTDWRFKPSATLGGDGFGYHWVDAEHFAVYLLDVCGHGVKAALLAVSALNVLRSQNLPGRDFRDPGQVLAGLNEAFPMEKQYNMYFTLWYGVFHTPTRRLTYAGGGHPSALLYTGPDPANYRLVELTSENTIIGGFEVPFESATVQADADARLFVFSDGAFEIHRPDGSMWTMPEFVDFVTARAGGGGEGLDQLLDHVCDIHGGGTLEDDFSILRVCL